MRVLPRRKFGDPILRKKAKTVSKEISNSVEFQTLIKEMFYTMRRCQGVGLAAPQVGESLQLAVIDISSDDVRANVRDTGKLVLINPKISNPSEQVTQSWEGCLSFPGVMGRVPRHKKITLTWQDEKGDKHKQEFVGFAAIVIQHEVDHLNGILFVDRMKDMKTLMVVDEFYKLMDAKQKKKTSTAKEDE